MKLSLYLFVTLILISCSTKETHVENEVIEANQEYNDANSHMHNKPFDELIASFESKERDATQKPYKVIELFGNLSGKKILDIGAGSGYFTFKLAKQGAFVIAGDVDDEFQNYIKRKIEENAEYSDNIELRKLEYNDPMLTKNEVDGAIVVNTYHHIDDRVSYFKKVNYGLKADGSLMIVDFKKEKFKEKIQGPPYELRFSSKTIVDELREAGYKEIKVNNELLPYQYIIIAKK